MATQALDRQPVLVCTSGALIGQRAPVGAGGLVLGRGDHCDLVIGDPGVSREHARVLMHNDAVWVQDAGSRNGCFINDRRLVRHKQLAPGDQLRIGQHTFTIDLVDPFSGSESVSTFGALPPPLQVDAPSPAGGSGLPRWFWPLVLAALTSLVLGAVCFSLLSS